MKLTAIKTHKITVEDNDIFKVLDKYIHFLKDESVVAIASKIVAICEGSVVETKGVDKDKLIEKEAEFFLPPNESKYHFTLTLKRNILGASAGIDESNGNGFFILWPKNPQESANLIKEYLKNKFNLKKLGVIITDSRTIPLRWGVTGICLSHSGFKALHDYIGSPDIFGRIMYATKLSVIDGLAAAATFVTGEGNEQTPICIIEDISNVDFQDHDPLSEELEELKIAVDDDLYAPILKKVEWKKGGAG